MPFLNNRLSRRFFLKGASAATAAGALALQTQAANADEAPKTAESPAAAEETKGPRLTIQRHHHRRRNDRQLHRARPA